MYFLSAILSGGSSPVDLDGTFFLQLIIFAVAFVALRSLIFQPVMALFDAREKAIDGAREEARAMSADADEKGEAFEAAIRKVKLQAGEERDRLRAEGVRLERGMLEKVRHETAAMGRDADARLESEAKRARIDIQARIPGLAQQIAAKLLGREVQ